MCEEKLVRGEFKVVIQPSLRMDISLKPMSDEELLSVREPYTLKFPPWLQKQIMSFRDQFTEKHRGVIPNVLILQDSYLVSAQFSFDESTRIQNGDEKLKVRFRELYENLEEWQGQMLFEWYGLQIYNRHHVIGNRDLPMIFLEVRPLHRKVRK